MHRVVMGIILLGTLLAGTLGGFVAPAFAEDACCVLHRIGSTPLFVVSKDPDVTTKKGCEEDDYWKKTTWMTDANDEKCKQYCQDDFSQGKECVHLYDYDPTEEAKKK